MAFRDYEEFIGALNAHGVRYLIVGGHAVAHHARPRATKDLDIFLDDTAENAARALDAVRDFFGGADLGYTVEDVLDPEWIIQLGVAPVRIDLFSHLPGDVTFSEAWEHRVDAPFGDVAAHYIGLDDLVRNKRSTARAQDKADLRVLQRALDRKRPEGDPPAGRAES